MAVPFLRSPLLFAVAILAHRALSSRVDNFAPQVEWTCDNTNAIDVAVHTSRPFRGIVRPRAVFSRGCSVRGTGANRTLLHIGLVEEGQECGVREEVGTDRHSRSKGSSLEESGTLWLELAIHEHPLLELPADRVVNVSCGGRTAQSAKGTPTEPFQLVFAPTNASGQPKAVRRLYFGAEYSMAVLANRAEADGEEHLLVHSCTATSGDGQSVQLTDSEGCSMDPRLLSDFVRPLSSSPHSLHSGHSLSTPNPWPRPRITVATARIPSMFRFNSQQQQNSVQGSRHNGELVRFECSLERCGGGTGPETSPCPIPDCQQKRIVALQRVGELPQREEKGELELVTRLLGDGAQSQETAAEEGEETAAVESEEDGSRELASSQWEPFTLATSTQNATGANEPSRNATTESGALQNFAPVTEVTRAQKQAQKVRAAVRVFETRGAVGSLISSGRAQTSSTDQPQAPFRPDPSAQPQVDAINTSLALEANKEPAEYHPSPGHTFPLNLFVGNSSPSQQQSCISPDQLLFLYQLCFGLCVLFLIGCCCNLLSCCCFGRRHRAPSCLKSPLRSKRGRRQQASTEVSSHTTLTSSLYGGNTAANGEGAAKKCGRGGGEQPHQVGFWISDRDTPSGKRGNHEASEESDHFGTAHMVTSIYGGLPIAPLTQQHRSSVHSYASVKQRNGTQLLCKVPAMESPGGQQLCQMSVSPSPHSHSPSTTTSSSGGTSGGYGCRSSLFGPNGTINPQQQQPLSRTFHPPQEREHDEERKMSLSIASSVRSSATLEGSPSSLADEDHQSNSSCTGKLTPRPSGDFESTFGRPGSQFSTLKPAQQQNGTLPQKCQHNESFSIL